MLLVVAVLILHRASCIGVWKKTRMGWMLIGLSLFLGVIFSDYTGKSVKGLYDAFRAAGLFFVAYAIFSNSLLKLTRKSAQMVFVVFSLLVFTIAIGLGIQQGNFFIRTNPYLYTVIGNLHEFANLAAVTLLVLICLIVTQDPTKPALFKLVLISCAIAAGIAIVSTISKGNWLAIAFCISFILSLEKRAYFGLWKTVLAVFILTYIYLIFFYEAECIADLCFGSTFLIRKELAIETLNLFLHEPWLGHGINTFKYVSGIEIDGIPLIMPHNVYVELLFSSGLIGSLLFCLGIIYLFHRRAETHGDLLFNQHENGFLHLTGKVILLYALLRGIVDMKLFSYEYLGILFATLGLLHVRSSTTASSTGTSHEND
ncbi:MAG: hypothetical protein BMS9Abin08_0568 [Gammaproteobacteria bacterium]|nr:MAG: hypothetical protein BMS9Abin08_0568 [Gammaproteobacteria bacterium]